MLTRICLATLSVMIASSSLAAAGEVVEVRILETKPANEPAAQPEAGARQLPRDAKVTASIEALADADGGFGAKCVVGGETLRLKGRVTSVHDGQRRVQVKFSHRNASDLQEVTSIVVMAAGGQEVISGSGTRVIVLTLKADEEPAEERDE